MMKFKVIIAAVLLVVLGLLLFKPIVAYGTYEVVSAKVTKTERTNNGADSKYLIFTENEVFENTDSFWYFKFNSSDVYGQTVVGNTCTFRVYGIRSRLLSWYRNVISVNCKGF